MGLRTLVTGGAGYIGAHTAAELIAGGHEVVIIDNLSRSDETLLRGLEQLTGSKPNFHKGDCSDRVFLEKVFIEQGPFDTVLHFAAFKSVGESVREPLLYYRNNVDSLLVLLEVMKEQGVRNLIFSSSCTVYGQPDQIPVDESAPFKRAVSPYGATKQVCERILEDVYPQGFRVVSLRYFNPIGAHPSALMGELPIGVPNNLVPYITQTAAGLREVLTIFGSDYSTPDGTCIRDFIHVVDVARAHCEAMEFLQKTRSDSYLGAFNLGTGRGCSVMELIKEFIDATGENISIEIGARRPGDVDRIFANPEKAMKKFDWEPKYSIRDSLVHGWAWEKRLHRSRKR